MDRLLPVDLDAEIGVLNAAFYPGGMSKVAHIVTADDFSAEAARLIFSKLTEYHESGRGFTPYSIDQSFLEHPQYIDIRRALDGVRPFTDTEGDYHATIVKEMADRRGAIKAVNKAFENLFDTVTPIDHVWKVLRKEISGFLKETA